MTCVARPGTEGKGVASRVDWILFFVSCLLRAKQVLAAKDYLSFNPRLETMVIEVRTEWPAEAVSLARDERVAIGRQLHDDPSACDEVRYDRAHTGFTRVIVATANDLRRHGVNIPESTVAE